MDTDFHFYGTGTAALNAGFNLKQANLIANAAEYVDFFNSDFWSNWNIKDNTNIVQAITYPQLTCQTIGAKMAVDYNSDLWNAFHFPPGNLSHSQASNINSYEWEQNFKSRLKIRSTASSLSNAEVPKLCRPYSVFALDMAKDSINKFRELNDGKNDLTTLINTYTGNSGNYSVDDREKLALILLGIRMHVFADTWAHQDFTGEASKNINGAGTLNSVYASEKDSNVLSLTDWTGTAWALHSDTDCAAAPAFIPGSSACRGHGQVGHFPDYSWLSYIYPAAWHPSNGYILRNNPTEYNEAWSWLSTVMASCLGIKTASSKVSDNPLKTNSNTGGQSQKLTIPADINDAICKKHTLDNTKLSAVFESEKTWQSTELGKKFKLNERWNNNKCVFTEPMYKSLGLIDGLAQTRYGNINVEANSTLHYMQLAADIHYKWCQKWAEEHPEFKWQPAAIKK
ncbi:DUF6765 family protein [Colwellia psychrerythraea]|uniref:Uncharacterized protein n=1 Tax=Colwellia psychrerythraea TaxID=28229 RepID=A0A099KB37_COLPS|nr:DUF6765 family protein [Colwellia psychrerythraea]KGJ87949.1 hypothetical protein GAB14E_4282 [Colwellia psychrerythraea]